LLAPHQDETKQGRRCNHATWSMIDQNYLSLMKIRRYFESSGCCRRDPAQR